MKGKPDFYWRQSKKEGYPARSVFKLQEMQEKYTLTRPGNRVLDLGASPGSWSLYLLDLPGTARVTGVDLAPPSPKLLSRKGYSFIQGNFLDPEIEREIAAQGPYDLVVSDAAPATTGNRTMDTARSLDIAMQVLHIAEGTLKAGGNLALKIFQGGEEKQVLDRMKASFAAARAFKPKASRSDSMETYYVGMGFRPS